MVDENSELFALVRWLHTFPEFGLSLYDGGESPEDAQRLHQRLNSTEATRAVYHLTEKLCGVQQQQQQQTPSFSNVEQIWTSLLIWTSSKARPLPKNPHRDVNDNRTTPTRLKIYVMGNLLDCAVQAEDVELRRQYIDRIMSLSKSVQKVLMHLIIRRESKNTPVSQNRSSKSFVNPSLQSPMSSPNAIRRNTQENVSFRRSQSPTDHHTPQKNQHHTHREKASGILSPSSRLNSRFSETRSQYSMDPSEIRKEHRDEYDDDGETNASSITECRSNTSSIRTRAILKYPEKAGRLLSSAFSPKACSALTPDQKRCFSVKPLLEESDERSSFLSPGTMDSPRQLTDLVYELQTKNEDSQQLIDTLKQREQELLKKLEESEAEHRRKLMKVESKGLDRIQEIQQESEEKIELLQNELEECRSRADEGFNAMHELKLARDELDLQGHNKEILAETTEKLRKYKEKVGELQDVRDALKREQDAHAKAVDDVVRLENEVSLLQPLKRRIEEYRFRAVEAEVKLVECQDYLRRQEILLGDQTKTNRFLRDGVLMQKEQLEELQMRIQKETESFQNGAFDMTGLGEGINELNPDLNQELIRLRNENLQLRAFAAKREVDSVQQLEESLEKANILAEKYKNEFLGMKEILGDTKSLLEESRHGESCLQKDLIEINQRVDEAEQNCEELDHQLSNCEKEIERLQTELLESNDQITSLRQDVSKWKKKSQDSEKLSNERMERLKNVLGDLEETTNTLRATEEQIHNIREESTNMENQNSKNLNQIQQLKRKSLHLTDELNETLNKLDAAEKLSTSLDSQIIKLNTEKSSLQDQLKVERNLRDEELEEAQMSLDATRQVLIGKHEKELDELQSNMNRLLEEERRVLREKEESFHRRCEQLQSEWSAQLEELRETSKQMAEQEKAKAIAHECTLKQEFEEELANERRESSEAHDRLIRKGKAMLEEAKSNTTKEIRRLDSMIRDLEDQKERLEKDKFDDCALLNGKITSLQKKLELLNGQLNTISADGDEFQEKIKLLEREKYKLQEDNDRFRRQLGGRFGADGKVQSTLENLQREYETLLQENRKLKSEAKEGAQSTFLDSMLQAGGDKSSHSFRRGAGIDASTLAQLRQEYEETIESLNDEKRELVMRNSAAITDVQKAEQRAWEREQDVAKLKSEITSLNLSLERLKMSQRLDDDIHSDTDASDVNTSAPWSSPMDQNDSTYKRTPRRIRAAAAANRSPGLERAYSSKNMQENDLRSKFSSFLAFAPRRADMTEDTEFRPALPDSHGEELDSAQLEKRNVDGSASEKHETLENGFRWFAEAAAKSSKGYQSRSGTILETSVESRSDDLSLDHSKSLEKRKKWNSSNSSQDTDTQTSTFYNDSNLHATSTLSSDSGDTAVNDRDNECIGESNTKQTHATDSTAPLDSLSDEEKVKDDENQDSANVQSQRHSRGGSQKREGIFERWMEGIGNDAESEKLNENSNRNSCNSNSDSDSNKQKNNNKESGMDSSSSHDSDDVDDKKTPRKKSTTFQRKSSVFERTPNKALQGSAPGAGFRPATSLDQKFSGAKTRSDKSDSDHQPVTGVLSISKKFEQQANKLSISDGSQSIQGAVSSISKKFEKRSSKVHSSQSSAFKMASAVFQVGIEKDKIVSKSPFLKAQQQQSSSYSHKDFRGNLSPQSTTRHFNYKSPGKRYQSPQH